MCVVRGQTHLPKLPPLLAFHNQYAGGGLEAGQGRLGCAGLGGEEPKQCVRPNGGRRWSNGQDRPWGKAKGVEHLIALLSKGKDTVEEGVSLLTSLGVLLTGTLQGGLTLLIGRLAGVLGLLLRLGQPPDRVGADLA